MKALKLIYLGVSLVIGISITLSSCLAFKDSAASKTSDYRNKSYTIGFENISKDELFTRAHIYIAKNFESIKHVIQYADKEAGVLIGNYIDTVNDGYFDHKVHQRIAILFKDNKIKVDFMDPRVQDDKNNLTFHYNVDILHAAHKEWDKMIYVIEGALNEDVMGF
jgi:hypothetical protein